MALGFHAKAVWGASGGGDQRGQSGTPPLRSQRIRPAQQMGAQLGEQEAMRSDPADGLEHGQSAREEVRCRRGRRQSRQSHTERGGLLPKAAYPELPALIRRRGLPRRLRSSGEGVAMEQAGPQKQRDHGEAEPQPRQRELRQQRNRTLTQTAQVAAHADHAIKGGVHERAAIETVAGQWLFGLALRAMVQAVAVWIRDRLCILLDRTVEWM